jgi:hypothetical protein
MPRSTAVSPRLPGIDVPRDLALVPHSRVSPVCIFLHPTCTFAVPTFCDPAPDMSNTNSLTLPYVFVCRTGSVRRADGPAAASLQLEQTARMVERVGWLHSEGGSERCTAHADHRRPRRQRYRGSVGPRLPTELSRKGSPVQDGTWSFAHGGDGSSMASRRLFCSSERVPRGRGRSAATSTPERGGGPFLRRSPASCGAGRSRAVCGLSRWTTRCRWPRWGVGSPRSAGGFGSGLPSASRSACRPPRC